MGRHHTIRLVIYCTYTILGIIITTSCSSPVNVDSAKFIDVLENISDFLDDDFIEDTIVYVEIDYDV